MKKTIFVVLLLVLLSSFVFAVASEKSYVYYIINRKGIDRITHYDWRVIGLDSKIQSVVYLEPTEACSGPGAGRGGMPIRCPSGTASIRSVKDLNSDSSVVIKVQTIGYTMAGFASISGPKAYDAWLVDENTGYRLNLGTFVPLTGGAGELRYSAKTYFDPYDSIEITEKHIDDTGLTIGRVVLKGYIRKDYQFFKPEPKPSLMLGDKVQERYLWS